MSAKAEAKAASVGIGEADHVVGSWRCGRRSGSVRRAAVLPLMYLIYTFDIRFLPEACTNESLGLNDPSGTPMTLPSRLMCAVDLST